MIMAPPTAGCVFAGTFYDIEIGATEAPMTYTERDAERDAKAAEARRRLAEATAAMAAEKRFGGPAAARSEIEEMEEATLLVRDARK
jgi:hypothetical protein